jgi:hypothetical protein
MKTCTIKTSTRKPVAVQTIECEVQKPETLAEAVEMYTEAVVLSLFDAEFDIKCQAAIRMKLEQEKSADEIRQYADSWMPSIGKEPDLDKIAKELSRMEALAKKYGIR